MNDKEALLYAKKLVAAVKDPIKGDLDFNLGTEMVSELLLYLVEKVQEPDIKMVKPKRGPFSV